MARSSEATEKGMHKRHTHVKQSRFKINLLVLGPTTPDCSSKREIKLDFNAVLFESSGLG